VTPEQQAQVIDLLAGDDAEMRDYLEAMDGEALAAFLARVRDAAGGAAL
jgi:hypothetical protein